MASERMSVIRPIEEMEEDGIAKQQISSTLSSAVLSSSSVEPVVGAEGVPDELNPGMVESSSMDIDDEQPSQDQQHQRTAHAFAARLGHAGLSPLVLGDVANPSQEYLSRLFPLNNRLGGQDHVQQAAALVAAAAAIQVQL